MIPHLERYGQSLEALTYTQMLVLADEIEEEGECGAAGALRTYVQHHRERMKCLPAEMLTLADAMEQLECPKPEVEYYRSVARSRAANANAAVLQDFIGTIADDMAAAGFYVKERWLQLRVEEMEFDVRMTRNGNIKFLNRTFRVTDGVFSTRIATRRLVQRVGAELNRQRLIREAKEEREKLAKAREALSEAMMC